MFTNEIGIWEDIMKVLSYLAVFTNLFLFSFATAHTNEVESDSVLLQKSFAFIRIEHLLIVIIIVMRVMIRTMPKWVKLFLKRVKTRERRELIMRSVANKLRGAASKLKAIGRFKK